MKNYIPGYIESYKSGQLTKIKNKLNKNMSLCNLCPQKCNVNRLIDEKGICNTGHSAVLASFGPHFGEEAPLVGNMGSGTIFFSNCNLLCNFCQNFDISHMGIGSVISEVQLSDIILSLQDSGCHNINFVTPSHVVPQIIAALEIAVKKGLTIPLVYNSSAYDSVETLKLLDGIIDIYMPDFKFWENRMAEITCKVTDYAELAKSSIAEMYKQVGNLQINREGVAEKGLLIRHLLMPNNFSGTEKVLDFIVEEISPETYVNIMPQYRPEGKAYKTTEISIPLDFAEFVKAKEYANKIGLINLL